MCNQASFYDTLTGLCIQLNDIGSFINYLHEKIDSAFTHNIYINNNSAEVTIVTDLTDFALKVTTI